MKSWQEEWFCKLWRPEEVAERAQALHEAGVAIATLNGSFDLMHAGHLHILYEASKVADCLVVALNSDDSIKRYKGSNRPLIPLLYRLQMVAAIGWVDYVTWFEEDDPRTLLRSIRPAIHVNGAEYGNECIEAETVRTFGRLHLVDRLPSLSTSDIIAKIEKQLTGTAAPK